MKSGQRKDKKTRGQEEKKQNQQLQQIKLGRGDLNRDIDNRVG